MNWYKSARWGGATEPLMYDYDRRDIPPSANHRKDEKSLVTHNPILGGDAHDGYPDEMRTFEEKPSEEFKNRRRLPGENVLMDQNPPTGEGVGGNQFVNPEERLPDDLNSNSVRLDKGFPPITDDIYRKFRNKTRLKAFNKI